MTKYNTIPAGYKVTVTTWENDGDHSSTESLQGLFGNEVDFLVALCKLFTKSSWEGGYGNILNDDFDEENDSSGLHSEIGKLCKEHGIFQDKDDPVDWIDEVYLSPLNIVGRSESFYSGVVENIVVEYIHQEIKIEDVTEEFV